MLLLEELTCNRPFREWFWQQVYGDAGEGLSLAGVWHSLTETRLGESDLVLVREGPAGRRWALLIENKIDAAAQPEQALRYRRRGQVGVESGQWDLFQTCMVAPEAYLEASASATRYDGQISYETVQGWLEAAAEQAGSVSGEPDPEKARLRYKARMWAEAIEQNRRGYQLTPDEAVTRFWHEYWRYLRAHFPQLEMKQPGKKPSRADWPEFSNTDRSQGHKFFHKMAEGAVDLQFSNRAEQLDELYALNADLLPEEIEVVAAGRSASFRIRVPEVDRFAAFADQVDEVKIALEAATRLLELYPQLRGVNDTNEQG